MTTCQLCGQRQAEVSLPDGFGEPIHVCGHCSEDILDGKVIR